MTMIKGELTNSAATEGGENLILPNKGNFHLRPTEKRSEILLMAENVWEGNFFPSIFIANFDLFAPLTVKYITTILIK